MKLTDITIKSNLESSNFFFDRCFSSRVISHCCFMTTFLEGSHLEIWFKMQTLTAFFQRSFAFIKKFKTVLDFIVYEQENLTILCAYDKNEFSDVSLT